jgi:hypothetical protein
MKLEKLHWTNNKLNNHNFSHKRVRRGASSYSSGFLACVVDATHIGDQG